MQQPEDSPASFDRQGDGTPFSEMMVPDGYGAIWCDTASRAYTADPQASAILNVAAGGRTSEAWLQTLITDVQPQPDGGRRYTTFRNHRGDICRARLVPSPPGSTLILVENLKAITNRFFQLKASEREYRELFENATYGIYRASFEGRPLHVNPYLVRLHGYGTEAEMLEAIAVNGRDDYVEPGRRQKFLDILQRDGKVSDFVSEIRRHRTSERIWISESGWIVSDAAGQPRYLAGTVAEVTERMRHLGELKAAAETDALTGLANRHAFNAELAARIAASGTGRLSVFLIDIDRFKDVNDVYGHARGDAVLQVCADRLRAALHSDGLLARLGGDEFALLTSSVPDASSALALARTITAVFEQPITVLDSSHLLGASVGIAQYPEHAATALDIMRNADMALYSVKDSGRGRACIFDSEFDRLKQSRHAMEMLLRGAGERGELELFYQPIVDVGRSRIAGLEALLRWRHPVLGLMLPGDFIPVAEDSGQMIAIGNWVIREACRHAAALPAAIAVAVNVSALQFRSSDLPQVVAAALASNQLAAARLELEVTESVVLKNEDATLSVLRQLHALGVKIALDDFGTGYSTLSYLQRFPFDKVKIDKTFVSSIKSNAVNRAVTRAVLSIGRDLGLAVVAEGIETVAELQTLVDEGCTLLQGYLFGEPMSLVDVSALLAREALCPLLDAHADHEPLAVAQAS